MVLAPHMGMALATLLDSQYMRLCLLLSYAVELLVQFRDAMLARPNQVNWTKALASWTCPTDPSNSAGDSCDPCGSRPWGNWEHVACRGYSLNGDTYATAQYKLPGDGRVTDVHITDYHVEGSLPLKELCPLTRLRQFDVDGNNFVGSIPTEWSECFDDLREIDLSFNELTGTIPPEIAKVVNLEEFKVDYNQLEGSIPPEFGSMAKLHWLRLSNNSFTGEIPSSFSNLNTLSQLEAHSNDLEGNLYALYDVNLINTEFRNNPKLCGMVPIGVRFAHGFNYAGNSLGVPCPDEIENGWQQ